MTDAADDTFAGLTDYVPVYEMDVAGGALVLGFGTSQDDERVSLSRVDSMLLTHAVSTTRPRNATRKREAQRGPRWRIYLDVISHRNCVRRT